MEADNLTQLLDSLGPAKDSYDLIGTLRKYIIQREDR